MNQIHQRWENGEEKQKDNRSEGATALQVQGPLVGPVLPQPAHVCLVGF